MQKFILSSVLLMCFKNHAEKSHEELFTESLKDGDEEQFKSGMGKYN